MFFLLFILGYCVGVCRMAIILNLFQRALGVVNVNPGSQLHSDRELLRQHINVSLQRFLFVVCGTACVSPILYKIAMNLTLSQQNSVRQFLDAEEKKNPNKGVRVLYTPSKEELHTKKTVSSSPSVHRSGRGASSSLRIPMEVTDILYNGCRRLFFLSRSCVCQLSATLGGGTVGRRREDDLGYRLVSYAFTFVVKHSSVRLATRCAVHLSFFVICKALDGAIAWAATSPKLSAYIQPVVVSNAGGGGESNTNTADSATIKGVYQLGDFSQSAPGYIARSCGRVVGRVVTGFQVLFSPHINFYWVKGEMADTIWSQLTPTGFLLTTALGVLHPLLRLSCTGAFRSAYLLIQRRKFAPKDTMERSSNTPAPSQRNGGVITVGKVVTRRRFISNAMTYVVNYHFLGSPIIAYLAATYSWGAGRCVWYSHAGGAMYEAVSMSLFVWSLVSLCLRIPDMPLTLSSA